jgi:hypothetical protein
MMANNWASKRNREMYSYEDARLFAGPQGVARHPKGKRVPSKNRASQKGRVRDLRGPGPSGGIAFTEEDGQNFGERTGGRMSVTCAIASIVFRMPGNA